MSISAVTSKGASSSKPTDKAYTKQVPKGCFEKSTSKILLEDLKKNQCSRADFLNHLSEKIDINLASKKSAASITFVYKY